MRMRLKSKEASVKREERRVKSEGRVLFVLGREGAAETFFLFSVFDFLAPWGTPET
jgi:hypothetical protein